MAKNGVIFVGWIRKGKPADCGETMKNQLLIQRLEELGVKCRQMDFKGWRRRPWIFLQLVWNMVIHRNETLVFSTSAQNVYPLMRLMKWTKWKQNTVHWVIGGSLGKKTQNGVYRADVIGYMRHTIVESNIMVEELQGCGVGGVMQVPNFKPIDYYPKVGNKKKVPLRFVFLSRIMPEKGCDYILEAAKILNTEGLECRYSIDFYGKIAESYKDVFERKVAALPNVTYSGFLNLRENYGYDTLSAYDLMLFPTYWKGEGFAGVFIDTFIAGVPMIATNWAHNSQFLKEGETALFIPVHDIPALANKMKECITGKFDLNRMSAICQKEAEKYNIDNVVTLDVLRDMEIIKE